ncbi:MAG: hypothetical protein WC807_16465 [Hyphomicrobium sp.]|jgi:hypothetical protein
MLTGLSRQKLVFVLRGVLAAKEVEDGNEYLGGAGYEVLKGAMFMQRAHDDAQNFGPTALETKWESLNLDAAKVVASVIREVREVPRCHLAIDWWSPKTRQCRTRFRSPRRWTGPAPQLVLRSTV